MKHTVVVNLSNRHIHLSEIDFTLLFGEGATLTRKHDLMQPDQFAAQETVTIVNPQNESELPVRVLGPFRDVTQCEVSVTDARKLGIPNVPVRLSGDLEDSAAFTIRGPHGSVEKERGLIVAARHIHLDPDTAKKWKVSNGDTVSVEGGEGHRYATLHGVSIRVSETFLPECHLDFDEGNTLGVSNGDTLSVVIQG